MGLTFDMRGADRLAGQRLSMDGLGRCALRIDMRTGAIANAADLNGIAV